MHMQVHSVIRLPIHLPNQQYVQYIESESIESIMGIFKNFKTLDRSNETMLTQFFSYCAENPEETHGIKYHEFPEYYVWDDAKWKRRRTSMYGVGRLYTVSPSEIERFSLRSLLLNVSSPKSFKDLRTVRGQEFISFRSAGIALGLFENDNGN